MTGFQRYTISFSADSQFFKAGLFTMDKLLKNGEFQCSCMAWTRNVPRKHCKHIVAMIDRLNSPTKVPGVVVDSKEFIQKPQGVPAEVVDLKKEMAKVVDPKEVLDTDSDTMARGKLLELD